MIAQTDPQNTDPTSLAGDVQKDAFPPLNVTERLVGDSAPMSELKRAAQGIAVRQSTVMILGETGTGKEMLARYIHENSLRLHKPFIPVDCSSLSDTLFESELFGHVKGAFTGAMRDSLGFIRAADGGTLFLDEIGELSLPLQSKLLRVLQEKVVVPVGDTVPRPVDIRVLTATNRDLEMMVREGTFRQDLFFRLNVVILKTPALRERPQDILPLAQHFLGVQSALYNETLKKLSGPVAEILQGYAWPGNVRELANVMEHAHVLASGETIELSDIPLRLQTGTPKPVATESLSLEDVERHTIAAALKKSNYNKALASRMLGINIQRLNRRIVRLGIQGVAKN
jgi:transcriptional regulator with PAS, ATPase and Fis domain